MTAFGSFAQASARADEITVRIAGVTVAVSFSGCAADLIAAVHAEYASVAPTVPVSADIQIAAPHDVDPDTGLDIVRTKVADAIAEIHRLRGFIDFGAAAIIDAHGFALMIIPDGSDEARAALVALSAQYESLQAGCWVTDRSGHVVRAGPFDLSTHRMSHSAQGGTARLIGAVLLGGGEDAADSERADGIVVLARHLLACGSPNERTPALRAVQTVAAGTPGIRQVAADDLPRALQKVAGCFMEGQRARQYAAPFPLNGHSASATALDFGRWFRGPGHDYLQRADDVLIIRRFPEGLALDVLESYERAIWLCADGTSRDEIVRRAGAHSVAAPAATPTLADVFDELVSRGLIVDEPSWAAQPDVAYSTSSSQVVILGTAGRETTPLALEGPAMTIWECIVERPYISLTEVTARCAEQYDVETTTIRPQVQELVDALHRRGLIGWI